ncbi:hypothetical protein E2C01_098086 [Portunus trituberculatus]|uniref:Uncharacterized protein n=1 Tax=Portunus trituberculatus TaxID=210409 RepID=A0A5B7KBZ1_PORTR|nr:hypothetical protein [Portunus trituberculatus]
MEGQPRHRSPQPPHAPFVIPALNNTTGMSSHDTTGTGPHSRGAAVISRSSPPQPPGLHPRVSTTVTSPSSVWCLPTSEACASTSQTSHIILSCGTK